MAIINKSLANKYDSTKLYSVNDIVTFANKMYKCIIPITVAEEFDSSKWERCYLTDVINANTNNVNYVAPEYNSNETYLEGYYVLYGGYLYKCLEDDVTGEFDSSKWERCYLTESSLKDNSNSILNYGEFISDSNSSQRTEIEITNLKVNSYYEITIHTSKIACEIVNLVGGKELESVKATTSYDGRSLILANFKTTSDNVTISLSGKGLVTYILRKIM